jgi:hypothetical protein
LYVPITKKILKGSPPFNRISNILHPTSKYYSGGISILFYSLYHELNPHRLFQYVVNYPILSVWLSVCSSVCLPLCLFVCLVFCLSVVSESLSKQQMSSTEASISVPSTRIAIGEKRRRRGTVLSFSLRVPPTSSEPRYHCDYSYFVLQLKPPDIILSNII